MATKNAQEVVAEMIQERQNYENTQRAIQTHRQEVASSNESLRQAILEAGGEIGTEASAHARDLNARTPFGE